MFLFLVVPPRCKDKMLQESFTLTQTATLRCCATGYNVLYKWIFGSGSFPSKVTGINSNTLVIPDVRSSDDNTYACMASNEGGTIQCASGRLTVTGMYYIYYIVANSGPSISSFQADVVSWLKSYSTWNKFVGNFFPGK